MADVETFIMSKWPPVWMQLAVALTLSLAIIVILLAITGALQ